MFTKSSLTEHPVRVKIATRAQTEQFALLSEQHWPRPLFFLRPKGHVEAAPAALHGKRGLFSFTKENSPLSIPQEKGFDWQSEARTAFMPPECKCLRAASPRLVLLYDLTLSYYPLPLC